MADVTPSVVQSLITRQGALYVPTTITDAISSCVVSDPDTIRREGNWLKEQYEKLNKKYEPMLVDYSRVETIDAYTVYYLPRNTLVPKLSMLCCAYNEALQGVPEELRILDVGSGTGGVVLGLLDLFGNAPLSQTILDIVALDRSPVSLARQEALVECLGLRGAHHRIHCADLSDQSHYKSELTAGAPYDLVFVANVLAELSGEATDALLQCVAPLLSESGIVVNVESQSNYAMRQRVRVVKAAARLGLQVYYPCPPERPCREVECWRWREDEFDCADVMVGGETIEPTKIQKAHWTVLCRGSCSIYDVFRARNSKLTWGVAARTSSKSKDDKVEYGYDFCTEAGPVETTITRETRGFPWIGGGEPVKRGAIVGLEEDARRVSEGWDIVSGFTK